MLTFAKQATYLLSNGRVYTSSFSLHYTTKSIALFVGLSALYAGLDVCSDVVISVCICDGDMVIG